MMIVLARGKFFPLKIRSKAQMSTCHLCVVHLVQADKRKGIKASVEKEEVKLLLIQRNGLLNRKFKKNVKEIILPG